MHHSPISSIACSEHYMATTGYDNQVILWKKNTKEFIARGWHDHLANKVVFSPDGRYLLSGSSDYSARIWSVPEMKLVTLLQHHQDDVEHVRFSPSGDLIATASRDHNVRIFNLQGELLHTLYGHTADVLSVAWKREGKELVSTGDDGTIRIWDVATGLQTNCLSFQDVETDTCDLWNDFIYAGNDLGEIIVVDALSGEVIRTVACHKAGIKSITIHDDLQWLLSTSYDKKIMLWQIEEDGNLQCLLEIDSDPRLWLRASVIVNQNLLAFGTFGTCYALYSLAENQWDFSRVEDTPGVNAVLAVADDRFTVGDAGTVFKNGQVHSRPGSLCNFLLAIPNGVLTGGQTGQLFNALTGEVIYEHRSPLNCGVVFQSENQTSVIIGSYTGEGILFRVRNNQLVFDKLITLHSNAIKGMAASDKQLCSVSANREIVFYNLQNLQLQHKNSNAHTLIANGCAFLFGNIFVSISRDRMLRFWAEGNLLEEIATPHTHSVKCIKVADSNRNLIATGSYNGFFAIYNYALKSWVFAGGLTSSGISSISFQESTAQFLASSYDGKVYEVSVPN